jgi:hypothetical protein
MTAARPDNKALARAFCAELFNAHDLGNVRGFFAPGFVNHNARSGSRARWDQRADPVEGSGCLSLAPSGARSSMSGRRRLR